jgi:hypothetical protein
MLQLYYWKEYSGQFYSNGAQLITGSVWFILKLTKKIIFLVGLKKKISRKKYIEQMVLVESNYKLLFISNSKSSVTENANKTNLQVLHEDNIL